MRTSLRLGIAWPSASRSAQLAEIFELLTETPSSGATREVALDTISARLDNVAHGRVLNSSAIAALQSLAWFSYTADLWDMNFHMTNHAESQARDLVSLMQSLGACEVRAVLTDDDSGEQRVVMEPRPKDDVA